MDNPFDVRIECDENGVVTNLDSPLISWQSDKTQFTIEISPMPDLRFASFMRRTRAAHYRYDGTPLKPNSTYSLRVRSGLGPWSSISFQTAG